jgi:hypothetical protein
MALKPLTREERRSILYFSLRYPRFGARKAREVKQMSRRHHRRSKDRETFALFREAMLEEAAEVSHYF